jgi:hypothetical protein
VSSGDRTDPFLIFNFAPNAAVFFLSFLTKEKGGMQKGTKTRKFGRT